MSATKQQGKNGCSFGNSSETRINFYQLYIQTKNARPGTRARLTERGQNVSFAAHGTGSNQELGK